MSPVKPPRFLVYLFQSYCKDRLQEAILGDLEEQFEEDIETKGSRIAKRRFAWNVVRFFRPSIVKSFTIPQNHNISMLKSYFKIAYRNLLKYKFFSTINILGLAVGITMSLLIGMHLYNELSYETSYPKHGELYRLASSEWAKMPPLLATEFKDKMPEVKEVGRLFSFGLNTFGYGDREILVKNPYVADPSIIEMFDIVFVEGSQRALDKPSSILLTESLAERFFEAGQPRLGAVIEFGSDNKYEVTGIIKDFPINSHLKIDCMISGVGTFLEREDSRVWSGVSIFAWIESQEDVRKIEDKLLDFQVDFQEPIATRGEVLTEQTRFQLHPITDIHLKSHREKEIEANSDIKLVYIFAALALFILIVVVINFINLYVAQTLNRVKEIGLRKVMGAYRGQLIAQFLSEALFLVLVSTVLALLFTYWLLPYYNPLVAIPITLNDLFSPTLLSMLFILVLLVSSLAGGYPALYLSRLSFSQGLSAKGLEINGSLSTRKGLVAFQFLISIFLLTATLIVGKQMDFIQSKDMGFAKDQVLAIKLHGKLRAYVLEHTETVRNELLNSSDVLSASFCSNLIGSRFGLEPFVLKNTSEFEEEARVIIADPWFVETTGITIVDGGLATKNFTGRKYFLNEQAAKRYRITDGVTNQVVYNSWQENEGEITGVVKDFHFASLHNEVEPLFIQVSNEDKFAIGYLMIRVKSQSTYETIQNIESKLKDMVPEAVVVSNMIDDNLDQSYKSEYNMFLIFKVFSTVVIGLSCIGLFALFAFIAQADTKQMGIRKTLGASMLQILVIMSKGYLGIMLLMAPFAIYAVFYIGSRWLESFAYRISISWWHLILPFVLVMFLAISAIVAQCRKVAIRNPVESLRNE